MQYIEAISDLKAVYRHRLFLGGGISNCPDWQKEACGALDNLPISVYNPRRADFDVSKKKNTVVQIRWEHERLFDATEHLFWFPQETLCPITLFEFGKALMYSKQLFVGCHPKYQRLLDVKEQVKVERLRQGKSPLKIHTNFRELLKSVYNHYRQT